MLQNNNIDRISIQVGLSGYSFKVEGMGTETRSGLLGADRIFTSPELQKRYDDVALSVFTPKFTLVPRQFYSDAERNALLSDVADLQDGDVVSSVDVEEYASVLIYSNTIGETLSRLLSETVSDKEGRKPEPLPEMYYILKQLPSLPDYNKVLASYMDGYLYLAIAQGKSLLLCNVFEAPDFTTAEYYLFLAMKKLQLNAEVSVICFRTHLNDEEEMSLYRYFKSVEQV